MDAATLAQARAILRRDYADRRRSSGLYRGMAPLVQRCVNLGAGVQSNGTDTSGMYRRAHIIRFNCTDVRLVFSNYYAAQAANMGDGPNDITVKADVEIPVASITGSKQAYFPVTFNGARSVLVAAGASVVSDPIAYNGRASQIMYVDTYVSVASAGMKWPLGFTSLGSGYAETAASGAPTSDYTGTGNAPVGNNNQYGPSVIMGTPARGVVPPVTVAAFGDSITYGTADYTSLNEGWVGRSCVAHGLPYVNVSHPGEQAAQVQDPFARHRMPLILGCDAVVTNYGRNDLANIAGISLATFQGYCINHWTAMFNRGLRVYQCTVTPKSTSTDTWITVGNQTADTANSYEANRVAFNTWLRDGAPMLAGVAVATGSNAGGTYRIGSSSHPLSGVLDVADVVETARNSGKHKVGRTVTDAAVTSGTRTLTSATAAFTSADLDTALTIVGAGTAGATLVSARIITINSATSVTWDSNSGGAAATTVSGATAMIGAYTWDGTHPTPNAHRAIAAAIDLSTL